MRGGRGGRTATRGRGRERQQRGGEGEETRSTSANFGQLFFSSSANSTSANFDCGQFLDVEFWDHRGWMPKPGKSGAPKGGGGAQHFALFLPFSSHNFLSSLSLLGSFRSRVVV